MFGQPVLDLTAQMLPSNFSLNNTVVGFLDATINDVPIPGIKPEKFPAIYFVDANNSVTPRRHLPLCTPTPSASLHRRFCLWMVLNLDGAQT